MDGPPDFTTCACSLPRVHGVAVFGSAEALGHLERGAVLVDLREAYETNFRVFDVDRLVMMPWTAFAARHAELPRDEPLVLADAAGIYCREAASILLAQGWRNVAYLAGGMIEWERDGMPVRRDPDYELRGQCACKLRTRTGENPLLQRPDRSRT